MLNWGSIISKGWLTLFARGKKKWWDKCKDWLSQMRFFADENAELVLQGHPPKWGYSQIENRDRVRVRWLSQMRCLFDENAEVRVEWTS